MTYLAEIEEEVGDGKLDLSLLDGGRLGVSVLLGDSDQDLVISETRVVELSALVSLVSSTSSSPASGASTCGLTSASVVAEAVGVHLGLEAGVAEAVLVGDHHGVGGVVGDVGLLELDRLKVCGRPVLGLVVEDGRFRKDLGADVLGEDPPVGVAHEVALVDAEHLGFGLVQHGQLLQHLVAHPEDDKVRLAGDARGHGVHVGPTVHVDAVQLEDVAVEVGQEILR